MLLVSKLVACKTTDCFSIVVASFPQCHEIMSRDVSCNNIEIWDLSNGRKGGYKDVNILECFTVLTGK